MTSEFDTGSSLTTLYNPTVLEHIEHPRNLGRLDPADGVGTVDDPATENLVIIYVRVGGARITEARFRAIACSACIASASATTELLTGLPATLEALPDGARILTALGGLPESKLHCADIAATAARLALEQALRPAAR